MKKVYVCEEFISYSEEQWTKSQNASEVDKSFSPFPAKTKQITMQPK